MKLQKIFSTVIFLFFCFVIKSEIHTINVLIYKENKTSKESELVGEGVRLYAVEYSYQNSKLEEEDLENEYSKKKVVTNKGGLAQLKLKEGDYILYIVGTTYPLKSIMLKVPLNKSKARRIKAHYGSDGRVDRISGTTHLGEIFVIYTNDWGENICEFLDCSKKHLVVKVEGIKSGMEILSYLEYLEFKNILNKTLNDLDGELPKDYFENLKEKHPEIIGDPRVIKELKDQFEKYDINEYDNIFEQFRNGDLLKGSQLFNQKEDPFEPQKLHQVLKILIGGASD